MILTTVKHKGTNYDVSWKRGKDGPTIGDVFYYDSDKVLPAWELKREQFVEALRNALPGKKLTT